MKMKVRKSIKRVITFMLAAIMIANVGFINAKAAKLSSGRTLTVRNAISSMSFTANASDNLRDCYSSKPATDPSKILQVSVDFSISQADRMDSSDYDCGRIFPITVSYAGTLVIDTNATYLSKDMEMGLYMDAACEMPVDSYMKAPSMDGTVTKDCVQVPQAGTYYLRVSCWHSSYNSTTFVNNLNMKVAFYTNASLSLTANKTYYLGTSSSVRYYKMTVPSTKYLNIYSNDEFSFSLCDSNKKVKYDYQNMDKDCGSCVSYRLSKGTYYVKLDRNYADNESFTLKYTLSSDSTMKNKKTTVIYPGHSKSVTYLKFKPTVSGYVTVNMLKGYYDTSADITLCTSKKKALSEAIWVYAGSSTSNKAVFGVKKNTTYYLKITNVSGRAGVKFTQTKVSEKSGSSRKKAKTLKKNSTAKGTIVAGSSTTDWYKIKVTKSQKVKITTKGNMSGNLKMQLYKSNGKKYGWDVTALYGIGDSNTYTTSSKLPKGTYYIKIYRGNSKSNGYYTLKWK